MLFSLSLSFCIYKVFDESFENWINHRHHNISSLNTLRTKTFSYITTIWCSHSENLNPIQYYYLIFSLYSNLPNCPGNVLYGCRWVIYLFLIQDPIKDYVMFSVAMPLQSPLIQNISLAFFCLSISWHFLRVQAGCLAKCILN